jgi:hypothetical protein
MVAHVHSAISLLQGMPHLIDMFAKHLASHVEVAVSASLSLADL